MPSGPRRITKRIVDGLRPGQMVWDSEVKGFAVRCQRAAKVYVLKARVHRRQRWFTIGWHGAPWTPDTARRQAKKLLGQIADGADPAGARAEAKADPTVAELCDDYLATAPARVQTKTGEPKKSSTLATDRGRIDRHIKPLLGNMQVRQVTADDVKRFLQDVAAGKTAVDERTGPRGRAIVTGGRGTASRTVGLLGGIFSYAVERRLRSDNPVSGVTRFKDKSTERYLSSAELKRLGEALIEAEAEGENPSAVAGIRLLALTGARRSEIVTLHWSYVDFEYTCLRLPDSKTGVNFLPMPVVSLQCHTMPN